MSGVEVLIIILLVATLVLNAATLVMLAGRNEWFRQFMELLSQIEHDASQTRAIREDWERRGEGRIEE